MDLAEIAPKSFSPMLAKTNRIKELRPLVPQILEALARLPPGELIRIGG